MIGFGMAELNPVVPQIQHTYSEIYKVTKSVLVLGYEELQSDTNVSIRKIIKLATKIVVEGIRQQFLKRDFIE